MASLQTQDCILLGSTDRQIFGRTPWTDADQTFTIPTPLLTRHDVGCGCGSGAGHPRSSLLAAAIVVGLNREDVEWAKYRLNNVCVGLLVRWKAQQCPVANWPYIRAFQMTVPEIIIAVLHCLSNGRHVGLLCAFGLYQRATHM